MKKNYFLIIALLISSLSFGQLTINEIYYSDANDLVELKGPVFYDMTGWVLEALGANGQVTNSVDLTTFPDPILGDDPNYSGQTLIYVLISLESPGGYVILRDPAGDISEFFAYGAQFNGSDTKNRKIEGFTSLYIGRATTGESLQLTDAGWVAASPTPGTINNGQTLSVAKNEIAGFAMYPNPVKNGKFSISTNSGAQKHIEIFSVIGKQVYSKTINANETIDISSLNAGFYLVRAEEEGKVATRKLIVN